jgi:hypothetical protein
MAFGVGCAGGDLRAAHWRNEFTLTLGEYSQALATWTCFRVVMPSHSLWGGGATPIQRNYAEAGSVCAVWLRSDCLWIFFFTTICTSPEHQHSLGLGD